MEEQAEYKFSFKKDASIVSGLGTPCFATIQLLTGSIKI